jgi:hypothetical protein
MNRSCRGVNNRRFLIDLRGITPPVAALFPQRRPHRIGNPVPTQRDAALANAVVEGASAATMHRAQARRCLMRMSGGSR